MIQSELNRMAIVFSDAEMDESGEKRAVFRDKGNYPRWKTVRVDVTHLPAMLDMGGYIADESGKAQYLIVNILGKLKFVNDDTFPITLMGIVKVWYPFGIRDIEDGILE